MTVLRQSTEIKVRIGQAVFPNGSNGLTPVTGLTLGAADQAELLKANGAATVDISAATFAAITGCDGWYDLTLTTSHTDTVGELEVVIQDESLILPLSVRFQVVEEAIYDALYAASATGIPTVAAIADGVWDEVLTGATHNVVSSAGRRLRSLQDNGLYALAAVWVDEVAGTSTGTVDYEDATVTNRANDFDNAQTVAASLGLSAIYVTNGNSITLTATANNYALGIPGGNWTLALGGQDIGGCDINDAVVSGICTGTDPHFHNCEIGATTVPPCKMYGCGLVSTLTFGSAGDFDLVDCYSLVPGAAAPVIDLGAAVGATNLSVRRWSGGLTLNNVQTGDVVSIDGISGGTVTVNGTGGTVHIRGIVAVTDGSGGSVTIVQTQAISNTSINAEVDTAISDAALATASALATVDTNVDAILVDTNELQTDLADGGRLDLLIDAILADTNELQTDDVPGLIAALNNITVADILTTQMTESYAADGVAPTLTQALLLIQQLLSEFAISGTTTTVKKLDGSTTAATLTLDDSASPTSVTRSG